ncbi:hypothetical protein J1N35_044678 [Gossypium stocksii]|uniref:Uncharacterized protein n=1 Tax=Gossypium stocksii TaxID=47602 RepID=A0A9D3U9U8_9ROSI|nr:hypothetical protein J1N35_044678 [Gossypium stocksii]
MWCIPHNRVGQILYSVVLGTFHVGDQGEGIMPDLIRVIGVVLNSFRVGNQSSATSITRQSSTSLFMHGSALFLSQDQTLKANINSSASLTKNENKSSTIFNQTQVQKNEHWQYASHFYGNTN